MSVVSSLRAGPCLGQRGCSTRVCGTAVGPGPSTCSSLLVLEKQSPPRALEVLGSSASHLVSRDNVNVLFLGRL